MSYCLIVSPPGEEAIQCLLSAECVAVGRSAGNDVVVDHGAVSGYHFELRKMRAGGYELVDLNSKNGTTVNGQEVTGLPLENGDQIKIGRTVPAMYVRLAEGEKGHPRMVEAKESGEAPPSPATQAVKPMPKVPPPPGMARRIAKMRPPEKTNN